MNDLTNGHGYTRTFRKHWDEIVHRIGSCVPASLRTIYVNLTVYHLVTYTIKYLPLILYTVNFIRNLYKESRKRMQMWEAETKDVQLKLDLILCQEEEVKQEWRVREETLRRATEQYHRVRALVRQIIVRSDLHELKLPIDITHLQLNRTSKDESKLLEELIKDCNYEKEEPVDEKIFDTFYDRADTVDILKDSTFDSKDGKGYTIKFVKVTNVYKMSYLQHHYKQKRLQRAKHANLNKKVMKSLLECDNLTNYWTDFYVIWHRYRVHHGEGHSKLFYENMYGSPEIPCLDGRRQTTNNIKNLFNEWNNSLKAVTKKVYSVDSGISTDEAIGDSEVEETNEHVEERNESQDNVQIQNQCLIYGNYCDEDSAPENEIMIMDYTTKIFDNRRNYTRGDQALPVLPEETSSEIEIQELDLNVNISD